MIFCIRTHSGEKSVLICSFFSCKLLLLNKSTVRTRCPKFYLGATLS
jgi:hypothetical protein